MEKCCYHLHGRWLATWPATTPALLQGGALCSLSSGFQPLPLSYLPRPLLGTLYGVSWYGKTLVQTCQTNPFLAGVGQREEGMNSWGWGMQWKATGRGGRWPQEEDLDVEAPAQWPLAGAWGNPLPFPTSALGWRRTVPCAPKPSSVWRAHAWRFLCVCTLTALHGSSQ